MKKVFQAIKNKIDWICIVAGVYLISYNLLNYEVIAGDGGIDLGLDYEKANAWAYIYTQGTRNSIAIGFCLVILGVLLYKEKKK